MYSMYILMAWLSVCLWELIECDFNIKATSSFLFDLAYACLVLLFCAGRAKWHSAYSLRLTSTTQFTQRTCLSVLHGYMLVENVSKARTLHLNSDKYSSLTCCIHTGENKNVGLILRLSPTYLMCGLWTSMKCGCLWTRQEFKWGVSFLLLCRIYM